MQCTVSRYNALTKKPLHTFSNTDRASHRVPCSEQFQGQVCFALDQRLDYAADTQAGISLPSDWKHLTSSCCKHQFRTSGWNPRIHSDSSSCTPRHSSGTFCSFQNGWSSRWIHGENKISFPRIECRNQISWLSGGRRRPQLESGARSPRQTGPPRPVQPNQSHQAGTTVRVMAGADGEQEPARAPSWRDKMKVLMYIPNIVDYLRIVLLVAAFSLAGPKKPITFAGFYVLGFALDAVDGYVARLFGQVSAFGAFLDVALDNTVRALMWGAALPGPLGALVPCVEWAVFVGTHAQGGAAWKTGCFVNAPPWVSAVFANNFKSPCGVVIMAGLHFLPLWLWLHTHAPTFVLSQRWIGVVLLVGRAYCMAVELWTLTRHLNWILSSDALKSASCASTSKRQ